jgi:hypothetical protein
MDMFSSKLPRRLDKAPPRVWKSSDNGISVGLAGLGLDVAVVLGLVLEETEADFFTVVTEDEMELDLELDRDILR